MIRRFLFASLLATTVSLSAADPLSLGIVNFTTCITDSKVGKQEQASFEALKKQMSSLLEDKEKELNEIAAKFNDPEYLDGLSPEAEEDLKNKFRALNEEMNRYQNQYYQVLNQANMRIIQAISTSISGASEKVAKDKKLAAVLNKDASFYYAPTLDVTKLVIVEMDKSFDMDTKKQDTMQPDQGGKKQMSPPAKAPTSGVADETNNGVKQTATPVETPTKKEK